MLKWYYSVFIIITDFSFTELLPLCNGRLKHKTASSKSTAVSINSELDRETRDENITLGRTTICQRLAVISGFLIFLLGGLLTRLLVKIPEYKSPEDSPWKTEPG